MPCARPLRGCLACRRRPKLTDPLPSPSRVARIRSIYSARSGRMKPCDRVCASCTSITACGAKLRRKMRSSCLRSAPRSVSLVCWVCAQGRVRLRRRICVLPATRSSPNSAKRTASSYFALRIISTTSSRTRCSALLAGLAWRALPLRAPCRSFAMATAAGGR